MGNKSSKKKLPKEDLDFLTQNTKFTKNEIKDWYRGFMVSSLVHTCNAINRPYKHQFHSNPSGQPMKLIDIKPKLLGQKKSY